MRGKEGFSLGDFGDFGTYLPSILDPTH
jgi:hypothetical protein